MHEGSGRFVIFAETCPTAFLLHVAAEQTAKGRRGQYLRQNVLGASFSDWHVIDMLEVLATAVAGTVYLPSLHVLPCIVSRCHPYPVLPCLQGDLASQKCTITTGPQPFPPFDPTSHLKMGVTKSSATNYSPNSTLYPLSSLESYSATEGGPDQAAVDQMELQDRNISLASCESEAAEEWGLRRSPRNGGSRKSNVRRCHFCLILPSGFLHV